MSGGEGRRPRSTGEPRDSSGPFTSRMGLGMGEKEGMGMWRRKGRGRFFQSPLEEGRSRSVS